MITPQNNKVLSMLPPISATGAYSTTVADCAGYHYATIIINVGVMGATESFVSLKVQGSNDNSTFGDITSGGYTYVGTAAPVASTGINFIATNQTPVAGDDGKCWMALIDLRNAKFTGATGSGTGSGVRYLKLVAEGIDATLLCAVCLLSNPDNMPQTATARGVKSLQTV